MLWDNSKKGNNVTLSEPEVTSNYYDFYHWAHLGELIKKKIYILITLLSILFEVRWIFYHGSDATIV